MESPHKKSKLTLRETQHTVASSTPKKSLLMQTESPSISGIEMSNASYESTDDQVAENILKSSPHKENQNGIPNRSTFFDLLDSASSVTEFSVRSEGKMYIFTLCFNDLKSCYLKLVPILNICCFPKK